MFYKLIGMVVWNGGKFVLRNRYGRTYAPKPVLAGVTPTAHAGAGASVIPLRRGENPSG